MDTEKYLQLLDNNFKLWVQSHYFKIALFNIILILLVLLRSAGYFEPLFPLSINLIVFFSLILAILLLSAGSKSMFIVSLIFWLIATLFKIVNINVWAERAALYSYQALVIGMALVILKDKNLNLFKLFRKLVARYLKENE